METKPSASQDSINTIANILRIIGDDPSREGLLETPQRVLKSWQELFKGYQWSEEMLRQLLAKSFTETNGYDEMIVVRNIDFISFCEHHVLPFNGQAHLGYLPHRGVVGLSKIPRLVRVLAARLQIQERLTSQIAEVFERVVHPIGVGVVIEATHFCVACRGIRSENARMITSDMRGFFREKPETRDEFLRLSIGL